MNPETNQTSPNTEPTKEPVLSQSTESNQNQSDTTTPQALTITPPTATQPPNKSWLKILLIVIIIIVLVIGGILISTFLLAPNLFKATAPSNTSSTNNNPSSSTQTINTNTSTAADDTLKQDILKAIYISESSKQSLSSNEIVITNVNLISNTGGVITEEWSIDIGSTSSVYTVVLTPSPGGDTDYAISKKQ